MAGLPPLTQIVSKCCRSNSSNPTNTRCHMCIEKQPSPRLSQSAADQTAPSRLPHSQTDSPARRPPGLRLIGRRSILVHRKTHQQLQSSVQRRTAAGTPHRRLCACLSEPRVCKSLRAAALTHTQGASSRTVEWLFPCRSRAPLAAWPLLPPRLAGLPAGPACRAGRRPPTRRLE